MGSERIFAGEFCAQHCAANIRSDPIYLNIRSDTIYSATIGRPFPSGLLQRHGVNGPRFRYADAFAGAPMSKAARSVKCPQCGALVPWTPESKWRPFCSERCKMIDLGAWASERYRITPSDAPESGEPSPPDSDKP